MSKGHIFLSEPLLLLTMLKKFSIKCLRATFFYQSPFLCWMNKTTNMLNPNNYDSDWPNYIKKLLPKDPLQYTLPQVAKECTTGFQCEAGDTKLHFLMRDQLGPPSWLLTVTLFGDQLGPTYQCDRLSKATMEKFGWTKQQPRQHPWVKLPAQTRKIAGNVDKVQKFSITCIRATYFYQSPYLCWQCWKRSQSNV